MNRHADPSVGIEVHGLSHGGDAYVALVVDEFRDLPVICKKGSADGTLKNGEVYVRALRRIETTKLSTLEDMRELIALATEKELRRFLDLGRAGGAQSVSGPDPFQDDVTDFFGR